MKRTKRIAVVVSHPIQYHAVIWRTLAAEPGWDVEVLFCSNHGQDKSFDKEFGISFKWDVDLTQGYQHFFFNNSRFAKTSGFLKYVNFSLLNKIRTGRYDYLYVHGFGHFTHLMAMVIARFTGTKILLRNISYNIDSPELKSGLRWKLKHTIISLILRLPSYVLYIGQHNKSYFIDYGVPDSRMIHAPHLVDNAYFHQQKISSNVDELRGKYNLPLDAKVILFVGKLFEKKQPILLLEAFIAADISSDWHLMYVGTGEQEPQLRNVASTSNRDIYFLGFKNQSEVGELYAIADILVLPSLFGETWGLVVNEALNFDCAIIASDRVGCAPDIVEDKTGLIFDHRDQESLKTAIETLTNDSILRKKFQDQAYETVNACSADVLVQKIRPIINQ